MDVNATFLVGAPEDVACTGVWRKQIHPSQRCGTSPASHSRSSRKALREDRPRPIAPGGILVESSRHKPVQATLDAVSSMLNENAMYTEDRLSTSELLARWRALQNGDITIETDWYELNERGDIVVTPPPTPRHQAIAGDIAFQLASQLGQLAVHAVPVLTSGGILVPDVAWMPMERWKTACGSDPLLITPDICVEVLAPCNHHIEMSRKIRAYLGSGSSEVIVVGMQGEVRFWRREGESSTSRFSLSLMVDPSLLSAPGKV